MVFQGLASVENIADAVRKSGITKEELRLKDFKQVANQIFLFFSIKISFILLYSRHFLKLELFAAHGYASFGW